MGWVRAEFLQFSTECCCVLPVNPGCFSVVPVLHTCTLARRSAWTTSCLYNFIQFICQGMWNYDSRCGYLWEYLIPFTRFWGVLTAVVSCGVGIDVAFHHHIMGFYVIIASLIVLFLEVTWAVTLFLQVCLRNENSSILQCWEVVLWMDQWKKSIIYICFSVAFFVRPNRLWLSSVAGVMLILLGILYIILSFKSRFETKETLLHNREDSYDRFEDVPEVMEDILPETTHESLVEQDILLEM